MTPEEHYKLTTNPEDVNFGEAGDYWKGYFTQAYTDSLEYMKQVDLSYYRYLKISNNGLTLKSQWLQPYHQINQYHGYYTIILDYTSSLMTSEEHERISRQEVDRMFATGNFTGYRADNDLHTDYEKLVVFWWWINDNVEYAGIPQNGNSVYTALFLHKTVCQGFSAISTLFFNHLHIHKKDLFLRGILAKDHKNGYKYTGGELEWGLSITDYEYHYKRYTVSAPKDKPLLYQLEAKDSGSIGSNLRWTWEDGLLTIKGNGPMRDFENETLAPWKNFFLNITDLKIEENVTSIGAYAFYYVKHLTYEICNEKIGINSIYWK
ncbi:leucine-rich repeat protein [Histomonas meleagridis]|uniref:leucine-rich repeat protein n=1 Tax=Histomonas meleagridis TaxID=135588 RepID=UPI00355AB019|nr:leucine-rich repeat protein [Histomonas meleagridis]KAH0802663.1 leucine-rich repeat protein [Histomonas meleagridis]